MKRIHTEAKKGNRGHKWFPDGASTRRLMIQARGLRLIRSVLMAMAVSR